MLGGLVVGAVAIPLLLTLPSVAGDFVATAVADISRGLVRSIVGADVTYKKIVNEVWNEKT